MNDTKATLGCLSGEFHFVCICVISHIMSVKCNAIINTWVFIRTSLTLNDVFIIIYYCIVFPRSSEWIWCTFMAIYIHCRVIWWHNKKRKCCWLFEDEIYFYYSGKRCYVSILPNYRPLSLCHQFRSTYAPAYAMIFHVAWIMVDTPLPPKLLVPSVPYPDSYLAISRVCRLILSNDQRDAHRNMFYSISIRAASTRERHRQLPPLTPIRWQH